MRIGTRLINGFIDRIEHAAHQYRLEINIDTTPFGHLFHPRKSEIGPGRGNIEENSIGPFTPTAAPAESSCREYGRNFLRHHNGRRIGVTANQRRHGEASTTRRPSSRALAVLICHRHIVAAHFAGADRVIKRFTRMYPRIQLVIIVDINADDGFICAPR